jgi:hypothetical protein
MAELTIIIRTADQSRKAQITISDTHTAKQIIESAVSNWSLPIDADYSIVNVSKGTALTMGKPLHALGIQENDVLELQPILAAGA